MTITTTRRDTEDEEAEAQHGLVLLHAPGFERMPSAFLVAGDITIGRERADVVLDDPSVSREHARIVKAEAGFVLRDEGSKNGVFRGRERVVSTPLENGDVVSFGDVALQWMTGDVVDRGRYRIDGYVAGGRRTSRVTELLGGSAIDRLSFDIERIARTTLSCVVHGESGTGKELVARAIHRLSGRTGELVALNCAAMPAALVESELFGFRKGAFSGADRDRVGLVRRAHGGTLFLDEIADMPLEMQAKLLRVLEGREIRPLGAAEAETVDVRVVAASHADLRDACARGTFRGDLLARLAEHTLVLPPLRDRREDVYVLVHSFLAAEGRSDVRFSAKAMRALVVHDWPWNVRELRSAVKRALAFAEGDVIDEDALPEEMRIPARTSATKEAPSPARAAQPTSPSPRPDRAVLEKLLARHSGNVAAIGRELDREPAQVRRWLKRYGLDAEAHRRK